MTIFQCTQSFKLANLVAHNYYCEILHYVYIFSIITQYQFSSNDLAVITEFLESILKNDNALIEHISSIYIPHENIIINVAIVTVKLASACNSFRNGRIS